jgi:hypothetical protein
MPLDFSQLNTNAPQQLAAALDPNVAIERNNRLASLAQGNTLQQMQIMQGVNGLNEEAKVQQILQGTGGDPVKTHAALLQAGMFKHADEVAKHLPKKADPVSWSTVETDKGMMQVNPQTGETRPLGIKPAAKQTNDTWSTVNTEKGLVQVNQKTGQVRPLGINAPAKTGGGAALSPTAQKELFEADDIAQSSKNVQGILQSALQLNNQTYSGYGAKARAVARSNLPGQSAEADNTIQLDNMMTGQALESLKATFGGMPTEGERKILLDMQASADKTPAQRKDIMERAIAAAKRRETFAAERAKSLRAGTYFTQPPQTDAGEDQTWSDL